MKERPEAVVDEKMPHHVQVRVVPVDVDDPVGIELLDMEVKMTPVAPVLALGAPTPAQAGTLVGRRLRENRFGDDEVGLRFQGPGHSFHLVPVHPRRNVGSRVEVLEALEDREDHSRLTLPWDQEGLSLRRTLLVQPDVFSSNT